MMEGNAMRSFISRLGILGELLGFFWKRRMFWLLPMIVVLVLVTGLIMLGSSTGLGPLVYSIF